MVTRLGWLGKVLEVLYDHLFTELLKLSLDIPYSSRHDRTLLSLNICFLSYYL